MAGEEERLIAGQSRGFTGKARDQSAAHGSRAGWMSLPLVPIEISHSSKAIRAGAFPFGLDRPELQDIDRVQSGRLNRLSPAPHRL